MTLSPTDNTMEEFWTLVEKKRITTVVMLTSMAEKTYKVNMLLIKCIKCVCNVIYYNYR